MSDEEQENEHDVQKEKEHDVQKEKERMENLGVSSTWNVLSDPDKKKKKPEEKREFKGFK
jgi:hypothetical protein